jgi:hypothetical protein
MTSVYAARRTDFRIPRGLWPLVAEPGPTFRWGAVLRASKPRRVVLPDGTVKFIEESTDRQDLELLAYIRDNNEGVVVNSYKDVASAYLPGAKRPRYQSALADLEAGYIDGICCLAVDRLTRRRGDVRRILNAMEEMGGRLLFPWDELDTASDDPDTEQRLHELAARAEREAERTSRRYKLAAKYRARQGLPQRSSSAKSPHMRPMGHTYDWSALVPAEAELLNEAAEQIDLGKALYTICAEWTAKGIPTPRGKTIWRSANLRYTLLSPRMVGKCPHDGALKDMDDVPAILPEDLWLRVCEKLAPRQQKAGRREARQCSNIALCGICGLALIGGSDDGKLTYECRKRPAEPGACGGIKARSAYVDAQVDERVVRFLNERRRGEALLERHKKGGLEMAAIDARFAELEANRLNLEEDRYNPPSGMKPLPADDYWTRRGRIEAEQEQLQRRRVVSREAEPLRKALKQSWTLDEWQAKPVEFRRAIIKLVTARVEVTKPARYGAKKGEHGAKFDPKRVVVTFADE